MNTTDNDTDVRPQIIIDTDEFRCIEETISALRADENIFSRGNVLVRVLRDDPIEDDIRRAPGSPTVRALPPENLRERMTKVARFVTLNKKGEAIPAHPSPWLVSGIDYRGQWPGIRSLRGVSDVPILRADGSIWQTPGYDKQTGVLYEPAGLEAVDPIDPDVNLDDAHAALERLLEVVCDFRFESDEHRAAWVAGLLTCLSRYAFDGPAPLFLVDANIRAAGKGLLCQTIGRIAMGRDFPVSSYAHDSQEMRKKITAIALAADSVILLDNLAGKFGNDALDRALTAMRWKDRLLGRSEEVDLPLNPTWFATGNNVQVCADTMRRIIHIRLEVMDERPEQRCDFKHPELLAWVSQNRSTLLRDALTILSAFIRAGKPKQGIKPLGSFEAWSALVRGAVVWVGLPDPCLTQEGLAEAADTDELALAQLLIAWKDFNGLSSVSVRQIVSRLYPDDRQYAPRTPEADAMRVALETISECPPNHVPDIRAIGNRLREFRMRVVDGLFLMTPSAETHTPEDDGHTPKAKRSKHGMLWKVAEKGVCGASGVSRFNDIHQCNPN